MNSLRIISIIGIPLLQAVCILFGMQFEQWYALSAIAAFIITDIFLAFFFVPETKKMHVFTYSYLPLVGVLGTFGLVFLVESDFVKSATIITSAFVQFLYFLNLYYALFRPKWHQQRALFHAVRVMAYAVVYCMSAIVYGFSYYLNTPYWQTFPPFFIVMMLLVCQILLLNDKKIKKHIFFLGAFAAVISEVFFVISTLPSTYYVSAALFTALIMAGLQLAASSLRKEQTHMETVSTVLITACVVVLIVVTASWR
ncbi:MAG: hypothetical protein Q7S47_00210 [bacterium]|nr:hypothetical protein [bacterium]